MSAGHDRDAHRRFQPALDRTLYWTLSFYIPADKVGAKAAVDPRDEATIDLREAVEPLFSDIADRSRLGVVEDRMFAAAGPDRVVLRMPARVAWTTEGCSFSVDVRDDQRSRHLTLRRFWYQHGNGALSWHLSFDYFYGDDIAREQPGSAPVTWYFLSLLQKLAWPKEFRWAPDFATTDQLVGIDVLRGASARPDEPAAAAAAAAAAAGSGFWAFVEECFARDAALIAQACRGAAPVDPASLLQRSRSIEVPELECFDTRSLFFIHDKAFFDLIQPVEAGQLVRRRRRVLDRDFRRYPELINDLRAQGQRAVTLGSRYWAKVRGADDPQAEARIAYLFLAGFNQNIIDFMNQDASEVLDSLDPIYPRSDEQEEEGFFVRYANPRSLITYVPRSRSLEVGNDHIGTCPYAFLIHAVSMHNEALTRDQEQTTFRQIEAIGALIEAKDYELAEDTINALRRGAFEVYDRHRYVNPFRYDTERDVFDALERLRGTSRLKQAYEGALGSLEEQIQDLARHREQSVAAREAVHDRRLALLFGVLGVSGVVQVLYQVDTFAREREGTALNWLLGIGYCALPVLIGLAIYYRFLRSPTQTD